MLLVIFFIILQTIYFEKVEGTNLHITHQLGIPNDFRAVPNPFSKIGSKYYMIENNEKVNWFTALMKCREIGGNLANLQSIEDLRALEKQLKKDRRYWVDLNDLAKENEFRSSTTGKLKTEYPKWDKGEPNNLNNSEDCVHLFYNGGSFVLNDYSCYGTYPYICETNYPQTMTVVTW